MTVWAILAASLIGSPHCAAMCGLVAGAAAGSTKGDRLKTAACYHAARLAGYLTLGLALGWAGSGVERLGAGIGWTGAASRVAGIVLIGLGVVALTAAVGGRRPGLSPPARWIGSLTRGIRTWPPMSRAAALGVLTAAFPCGWLYAFLAAALGAGGPFGGALAMAVFWLGTVPALVGAGLVLHRLAGAFRARLPLVAALALIVLGLVTAFLRPGLHQ